MTKLLCCVLNGEYHSKWKDQGDKILCQGCITDLLKREYEGLGSNELTNLFISDFRFLHPTSDCNFACMGEHLFENSSRLPKII